MDKHGQRFLDVFLEESREHLDTMESCLLALEAGGTADHETLNRIFRAAHTIKGGSGMFGLETTARFTHGLENLLDQVRSGQLSMTPPLIDVLLRSCDVVKGVLAAEHDGTPPPPIEEMLKAIERESKRSSQGDPEPIKRESASQRPAQEPSQERANLEPTRTPPSEGESDRLRIWQIRLTPSSDIFARGLNPLLAFRELAELGRVFDLKLDPGETPRLSTLDPEQNHLRWTLCLESKAPAARIREVFDFLHDGDGLELINKEAFVKNRADDDLRLKPIEAPAGLSRQVPEAAATPTVAAESGSTIRVDVELLDRLMNQVGELVLARNQILQFSNTADDAALIAASQRLNLITSELQEGVMKTRMQPIGVAWSMMPRLVRDLAQSLGKQIQLEMDGAETELDRTIIEAIKDPLTHLVRNSCDHGLENPTQREKDGKPPNGRLLLRAFHEGGHVIIEIADDGQGINLTRVKSKAIERNLVTAEQAARMSDREATHLIFLPGFSTAEKVSGISGRGVGMDVVRTNIERIGGSVDISSRPSQGATVRIKIPLTLAIIPGMVVEAGGEYFVIPQVSLVELVRLEEEAARERIDSIHGAPVCRLRGKLLPLAYLSHILGISKRSEAPSDGAISIVVLQAEERQFGLVVDSIRDTQEIVVKPLGKQLKGLSAYSGATVMGDGRVVLILDVPGLAQLAGFSPAAYSGDTRSAIPSGDVNAERKQALLLFRSPGYERLAVPLGMVARLEEIPPSKIEISGGRPVVQYRGRILPLTSLDSAHDFITNRIQEGGRSHLQVVVFLDGQHGVGLVVEEIIDIVEEIVSARKASRVPLLLGSAVVADQVTDFVNLRWVLENSGENWSNRREAVTARTVLVADASRFNRELVRMVVEMAGHSVLEAASPNELLSKLRQHAVDAVTLAADFEQAQGEGSLLKLVRSNASRPIPVLGIGPGSNAECDAHVSSFDGEEIGARLQALLAGALS